MIHVDPNSALLLHSTPLAVMIAEMESVKLESQSSQAMEKTPKEKTSVEKTVILSLISVKYLEVIAIPQLRVLVMADVYSLETHLAIAMKAI